MKLHSMEYIIMNKIKNICSETKQILFEEVNNNVWQKAVDNILSIILIRINDPEVFFDQSFLQGELHGVHVSQS